MRFRPCLSFPTLRQTRGQFEFSLLPLGSDCPNSAAPKQKKDRGTEPKGRTGPRGDSVDRSRHPGPPTEAAPGFLCRRPRTIFRPRPAGPWCLLTAGAPLSSSSGDPGSPARPPKGWSDHSPALPAGPSAASSWKGLRLGAHTEPAHGDAGRQVATDSIRGHACPQGGCTQVHDGKPETQTWRHAVSAGTHSTGCGAGSEARPAQCTRQVLAHRCRVLRLKSNSLWQPSLSPAEWTQQSPHSSRLGASFRLSPHTFQEPEGICRFPAQILSREKPEKSDPKHKVTQAKATLAKHS